MAKSMAEEKHVGLKVVAPWSLFGRSPEDFFRQVRDSFERTIEADEIPVTDEWEMHMDFRLKPKEEDGSKA